MTISFKKFYLLNEAIPLDVAKDYLKRETTWDYRNGLKHAFGDKSRIIIDHLDNDSNIDNIVSQSPLYLKIAKFIESNTEFSITPRDYVEGMARSRESPKSKMRIGRLLGRYNKETQEIANSKGERVTVNTLLHEFKNDPLRQVSNKPFSIVISKHPYDVMGASTDRNWTSCMDMGTPRIEYKSNPVKNKYPEKMDEFVKYPVLIAYLVDPSDVNSKGKLQIRRPISRIMIYPFQGAQHGKYAYSVGEIHGVESVDFLETVKQWVFDELNLHVKRDDVYYHIGDLYYDDYDTDMLKTSNTFEETVSHTKKQLRNIEIGDVNNHYEPETESYFIVHDIIFKNFLTKEVITLYQKIENRFQGLDVSGVVKTFTQGAWVPYKKGVTGASALFKNGLNNIMIQLFNRELSGVSDTKKLFKDKVVYDISETGSVELNVIEAIPLYTWDTDYHRAYYPSYPYRYLENIFMVILRMDGNYTKLSNEVSKDIISYLTDVEEFIEKKLEEGIELQNISTRDVERHLGL